MVQFVNMFLNFIAGIWTVVFAETILDFGSFDVALGDIVLAGIIVVMAISLYWKGARG